MKLNKGSSKKSTNTNANNEQKIRVRRVPGTGVRLPKKFADPPVPARFTPNAPELRLRIRDKSSPVQIFEDRRPRKLGLWPLVMTIFFCVSGGPYGLEPIVEAGQRLDAAEIRFDARNQYYFEPGAVNVWIEPSVGFEIRSITQLVSPYPQNYSRWEFYLVSYTLKP